MPSPFWGCAGGAMRPNAQFRAFACGRQKNARHGRLGHAARSLF